MCEHHFFPQRSETLLLGMSDSKGSRNVSIQWLKLSRRRRVTGWISTELLKASGSFHLLALLTSRMLFSSAWLNV